MPILIILIIIVGAGLGVFIFFLIKAFIIPKRVSNLADLIRQGKTLAASRIAKQLIARDPRNAEAHYFLGLAYLGENKPELALMEFKTVNQIGQFGGLLKEIPFRKKIAELFVKFNQPEEALKEYLLLIKAEPYEAEHYFQAGKLFEERNRSVNALTYYKKAIELDPKHGMAHALLGVLLYKAKKPVEAKAELDTALKLLPEDFKVYYYKGKLEKESHDYVSALASFEKAQKDPEFKVKALNSVLLLLSRKRKRILSSK